MGWVIPLECIALAGGDDDTGVVSITPTLSPELTGYLGRTAFVGDLLPPHGQGLLPFVRRCLPQATPKYHDILTCGEETFRPAPEVYPVSQISGREAQTSWYHLHFDGPVFVARNEHGHVVSWAAIKLKSDDVWEMAVVTEATYRGRGLARSVVSAATRAALDAGKVPLYLHDIQNHASARVCRGLGYQLYGHEFTCEAGRSYVGL
jgi:GNAT superfamily N-acetyltransferase